MLRCRAISLNRDDDEASLSLHGVGLLILEKKLVLGAISYLYNDGSIALKILFYYCLAILFPIKLVLHGSP